MPPDFYAIMLEEIRSLRVENREDHTKIFQRIEELEKAKADKADYEQPCPTMKEHVDFHKRQETWNRIDKLVKWGIAALVGALSGFTAGHFKN